MVGLRYTSDNARSLGWGARAPVCPATLPHQPGPGPGGSGRRGTGGHRRYTDATFTSRECCCRAPKSVLRLCVLPTSTLRVVGGDSVISPACIFFLCVCKCRANVMFWSQFSLLLQAHFCLWTADGPPTRPVCELAISRAAAQGQAFLGSCAGRPHGSSHVCPHALA